MTEFRIPLPFRCDEPRRVSPLTDPFRLEDDGRLAVLYLPEGSIVRLASFYGAATSRPVPDPYLSLEWTLPEHGPQSTLYWNGDGTYDGWCWGSNNPPDEPRKRPRKARKSRRKVREDDTPEENNEEQQG
jgi:hypothetical protein